ncbi:MAG: anhydro-N-acetylmuramic acid kinase [Alphaproteobacteria bacterium]
MGNGDSLLALGLMSGTSLDGVDAALIRADGVAVEELGPARTLAYEPALKERLRDTLGGRGDVKAVERAVTLAHAAAVARLLAEAGVEAEAVAVIGFPGHTIAHRPDEGLTWQIGDGALLTEHTGIDVMCDFRHRDMAAGGQGAPLTPIYHRALAAGLERPLVVLNLGGVANVTWIGGGGTLMAFDCGPGCAPLDDWVSRRTGAPEDEDGALARRGRVDEAVVARWLSHPYFRRLPPKSLDRDAFADAAAELTAEDGAATLAAFAAAAVAAAERYFPARPKRWLITGGGRRNLALMDELKDRLAAPVAPVEAVGWDGDALEAQAFAFLAIRALRGLPLTLPSTTGAARPVTGGAVHRHATRELDGSG